MIIYLFSDNELKVHNGEIWLKVGGDHGGNPGSFKFWLSPLFTTTPNSDRSTICCMLYHGKETRRNLELTIGSLLSRSINFLQETGHWR